jgi:hypothetical protein
MFKTSYILHIASQKSCVLFQKHPAALIPGDCSSGGSTGPQLPIAFVAPDGTFDIESSLRMDTTIHDRA